MPDKLQELTDQRVALIKEARAFLEECEEDHGGLTDEESARFDAMMADADKFKDQVDTVIAEREAQAERVERLRQIEEELSQPRNANVSKLLMNNQHRVNSDSTREPVINRATAVDTVLQAWAKNGRSGVGGDDFGQQFQASGCRWDTEVGGLFVPLNATAPRTVAEIRNAQSIGTDTAGGHTTFPGFIASLEQALLQFGGMRQVSRILRTATGSAIDHPTVNDTGNTGALLSENVQDAEQDATFGNLTLDAYKYTSKIVRVSVELMQDSAFNMGTVLGSLLGERLGRIQNTHATTGTGSSQPNGVVTAATLGKTAASASAITMDELLDLQASVDPAYRPMATWMFNDATRNYIRKLKSTDSVYHWQPGAVAGDPDRLFNSPVQINQDMASITNSAKTVLYGDFMKYLMREVLGITLVRMNERYADYHQVGFVAIMRFDSDLLDAGTNPIKYLQQLA